MLDDYDELKDVFILGCNGLFVGVGLIGGIVLVSSLIIKWVFF